MTTARQRRLFIAIKHTDGATLVHAAGGLTDYVTPCGQALDGDQDSGREVPLPPDARITCDGCKQLFETLRQFRPGDFQ